ncbi:MAG: beta-N-acetylhexosaminidase [Clostridia bacterium]|nr:beta-N-acetylhexosaminidase [Clostridia bacterium]
MKLYFEQAQELQEGIALLAPELHISLCPAAEADVTVTVKKEPTAISAVTLNGTKAEITFGGGKSRFFRALATLTQWLKEGIQSCSVTETPLFCSNGAMVDMSRNAVMNIETVQLMLRKMALMGMNTFMLYTEDTYELEEFPYFGYMRGRYTKEELRELDAYALSLGIELIPCIQTLGHLATALRWATASGYKDTEDVLMVGAEKTYTLIDQMLKTAAECFTSRRIHIGMDETHSLGTGKYLDRKGYRVRYEIFLEHLNKVAAMAQSYGFAPMMWSDMFFRMSAAGMEGYKDYDVRTVLKSDIAKDIPKGVQMVFWDYYNDKESFYSTNIEKHRQLGDNTIFAGGVWTWSGHCPLYSRSLAYTLPALDACKKHAVQEVLATVWHNGSEACLIMGLAGLAWYADFDYTGHYDENSVKRCFAAAGCGSYDDFMKAELPEHPVDSAFCATRVLLYNDPLIGLTDKHVAALPDTKRFYTDALQQLQGIGNGAFGPAFETVRRLTDLLINKADFGVRLKHAYDAKDREALTALAEECHTVCDKIDALRAAHRHAWMTYCKPFGWEVHDIRYGGLKARFETAKDRILSYLAGEISEIEELTAERLRYDGAGEGADPITQGFRWYRYRALSTPGIL